MPCDDPEITPMQLEAMKQRLMRRRQRAVERGEDTTEIDRLLNHIEEHQAEAANRDTNQEGGITVEDPTAPETDAKKKRRAKKELEHEIRA